MTLRSPNECATRFCSPSADSHRSRLRPYNSTNHEMISSKRIFKFYVDLLTPALKHRLNFIIVLQVWWFQEVSPLNGVSRIWIIILGIIVKDILIYGLSQYTVLCSGMAGVCVEIVSYIWYMSVSSDHSWLCSYSTLIIWWLTLHRICREVQFLFSSLRETLERRLSRLVCSVLCRLSKTVNLRKRKSLELS